MHELTITRHNPMIDPTLHIWGWEIPVYLFLGGMVAGIMVIIGYFHFSGRYQESRLCSCSRTPLIGLGLLTLGMLALFLDLEHKLFVWRLYTTFKIASPMSWGAWILILVYPALCAAFLISPPSWVNRFSSVEYISQKIRGSAVAVRIIGLVNMLLGATLGMYTGILLSALGARPLWSSALLWMLFLVSGMSSAAAFVHMIASDARERELLAKADNGFLILEIFIIAFFLIGLLSSTEVHMQAAALLLGGPFAPVFWVFVISLGIIIPLIIQLLAVNHKVRHTPVAPILVIAGGLLLRFVIVAAGQYSHWASAQADKLLQF